MRNLERNLMELPKEIVDIIKQFSKPLGMKPRPTPSCIAIYRSDEFRDYRTETLDTDRLLYLHRESWKDWLFWKCMLKVEVYGQESFRRWNYVNDSRPYSKSIYPDEYEWIREGMEINYWTTDIGKWKEYIEFVDVEDEKWVRW